MKALPETIVDITYLISYYSLAFPSRGAWGLPSVHYVGRDGLTYRLGRRWKLLHSALRNDGNVAVCGDNEEGRRHYPA